LFNRFRRLDFVAVLDQFGAMDFVAKLHNLYFV